MNTIETVREWNSSCKGKNEDHSMRAQAALEEPKHAATAPLHLLIVDDEETTRELCLAVAQQTGLKATAVGSAEEGLEGEGPSAVDNLVIEFKFSGPRGMVLPQTPHSNEPAGGVLWFNS